MGRGVKKEIEDTKKRGQRAEIRDQGKPLEDSHNTEDEDEMGRGLKKR
jgi:hypothetical protein